MKNHTDAILFMTIALAMATALMQSWPAACAFGLSSALYLGMKYIDRSRQDELTDVLARVKHVEEKVTGISIANGMRR